MARFILMTSLLFIVAAFSIWLFFSGKLALINTQEVSGSFSQFIALEGADEYVVAKLVSNEEFATEKYNNLMGFPIGDTAVRLSLVANYKYYVKLSELTLDIENDTVFIHVPKLYLSTPVAFEFSTVREESIKFLFGPDGGTLLKQLKKEASEKLIAKGQAHIGFLYDKAAKALADNINNYFYANGYGSHYKKMVVVFSSERSPSRREFDYNPSFCGKEPCSLELDLGKRLIFTIK